MSKEWHGVTLWSKGSTMRDKRAARGCGEWPQGLAFFLCTFIIIFFKLLNHVNAGTPGTAHEGGYGMGKKEGGGTG